MKTVSATEASRSFAALLDEVENGETIIVTRGGRRIAVVGPTSAGNGADVVALLRSARVDVSFADDVRAVRSVALTDAPVWPAD